MGITVQIFLQPPCDGAPQTTALQAAIDAASAAGGGQVVLRTGRHLSAGLQLRSAVDLHLDEGAELAFMPDYDAFSGNVARVRAESSDRAMILARLAHGSSITGRGTILAGGTAGYSLGPDGDLGVLIPARLRPRVLVVEDAEDFRMEGIRIVDSPMWTLHLVGCRRASLSGLTITNNRRLPNTDGVVIDGGEDVAVSSCRIETADDGVVLKSSAGPLRGVRVWGCTVSSQSCALKVGTETPGDIQDVAFTDCRVEDSNRALGIFSRDGGVISDITFARIHVDCHETPDGFWGAGEAFTLTRLTRAGRQAGAIRRVLVEDIAGTAEGAICLWDEGGGVTDLMLRRVAITQRPGPLGTGAQMDLRPTPADLSPGNGRANAWTRGANGRIVGLAPYPGGLPSLYAFGVRPTLLDTRFDRPAPLPEGWSPSAILIED